MQIVGSEPKADDALCVDTIDIWYSPKRKAWVVERLDAFGSQVGMTFSCPDEAEAALCLADWLRTHEEAHLVGQCRPTASEARILTKAAQAQAA